MSIRNLLFPAQDRTFRGRRWMKIGLRTLHLVGMAGVSGGVLLQVPGSSWLPYLWLTILSGSALLLLDLWMNAILLAEVRGVTVIVKIVLLACVPFLEAYRIHILLFTIILSGIISHAPARVRYFPVFRGGSTAAAQSPGG